MGQLDTTSRLTFHGILKSTGTKIEILLEADMSEKDAQGAADNLARFISQFHPAGWFLHETNQVVVNLAEFAAYWLGPAPRIELPEHTADCDEKSQ